LTYINARSEKPENILFLPFAEGSIMRPYRSILIGFIALGLVLANSPLHAKKGKPVGPIDYSHISGPKDYWLLKTIPPDLVVDSITLDTAKKNSNLGFDIQCVEKDVFTVPIIVTIRNRGPGIAFRGPLDTWFMDWSVITVYMATLNYDGIDLTQLPSGATAAWNTSLMVRALYHPDKDTSEFAIGAWVNPPTSSFGLNPTLKETNYQNNTTSQSFTWGGEICK
jgi:hypothetical protein